MQTLEPDANKSIGRLGEEDVVRVNDDPRRLTVQQANEDRAILEDPLGQRYLLEDARIIPTHVRSGNGRRVRELDVVDDGGDDA